MCEKKKNEGIKNEETFHYFEIIVMIYLRNEIHFILKLWHLYANKITARNTLFGACVCFPPSTFGDWRKPWHTHFIFCLGSHWLCLFLSVLLVYLFIRFEFVRSLFDLGLLIHAFTFAIFFFFFLIITHVYSFFTMSMRYAF